MKESEIWRQNIAKLKSFYTQNGRVHVLPGNTTDQRFLRWTMNIRQHPERLKREQIAQLEKVGFDFTMPRDWDTMFGRLKEFYKDNGHSYVTTNRKDLEDLFDWTISQKRSMSLLSPAQLRKLNSLEFDWGEDLQWWRRYDQLKEFYGEFGHTKVPEGFTQNKTLATWVYRQRKMRREKKLSGEKIELLNAVDFLWSPGEQLWDKRFQELREYKKAFGHLDRIVVKKDHYQLGLWMETQLTVGDRMLPERRAKLKSIGFNFVKGNFHDKRWEEFYRKLEEFKKKTGHCQVKKRDDLGLALWVSRTRQHRNRLSRENEKKLERLGFKWSNEVFNEKWEYYFKQLTEFKRRNGNLNVPRAEPQLYEWMQSQKKFKSEARLSKEREIKLNKLGFIWKGESGKTKMAIWEVMYKRFSKFQSKFSSRFVLMLRDNPELGEWVRLQLHSKDKLGAYKRKKLNAINFPWNKRVHYYEALWETLFEELVKYKAANGNCDVPQQYPENRRLAQWVGAQRMKELTNRQRRKLTGIGFSWSGEVRQKRWDDRLAEFLELKRKNKVSTLRSQTPLHRWIYQQKKNFDKLPGARRKILTEVGVV